jgi:hypothetical protein
MIIALNILLIIVLVAFIRWVVVSILKRNHTNRLEYSDRLRRRMRDGG